MSRRRAASAVPRKMTPERWNAIEDWLQAGWSPEPISGRFQQPREVMAGKEWIYQSIGADCPGGKASPSRSTKIGRAFDAAGILHRPSALRQSVRSHKPRAKA